MNKKEKLLQNFLEKNGCGVEIDYKNKDILIPEGGLWGIEKSFLKVKKIVGYKKLSNGATQILFSKKANHKVEHYKVIIWIEELRETINYLKRLEETLIKMGYNTNKEPKNVNKGRKNNRRS